MNSASVETSDSSVHVELRVRGCVQGVGFRPTVWRYAQELGLSGEVRNDPDGVLIRAAGSEEAIARLVTRLTEQPPRLARIETIERRDVQMSTRRGFQIEPSAPGDTNTEITPDAALCPACAAEVLDPLQRRFRYAFTNCTHCGPRLSITRDVPYDRAVTSMAPFALCEACLAEYGDSADRRFHAEAIACHACGPKPRLIRLDGRVVDFAQFSMLDDVDAAGSLLQKGHIVALKGLGGYQLACDAANAAAVQRLRVLKQRNAKPFALMARNIEVIRRYCAISETEAHLLASPQAPIVLLRADGPECLPECIAPGLDHLGFMLPTTPLHLLALMRMDRLVVMTSGNVADEPQLISDEEARTKLAAIAEYALVHDRAIANRVDDSLVRVMGERPRMIRRARGYAPASIRLPEGFERAPDMLAFGGALKTTFCMLKNGKAILSQHQGDLDSVAVLDDYARNLSLYASLFDHRPAALAADLHPEYASTKLAREHAQKQALPLIGVQHHHAHVASCLAENAYRVDAPPVLGIVLDGLGWGDDGALWGGEFLLADYRNATHLGTFKPVAMLGGDRASREPWRNLYAHLMAEMGWAAFAMNFDALDLYAHLAAKPRATLDAMIRSGMNAPKASSCGRLFDAVAAALDICRERQDYEGEAAMRLEALANSAADEDDALAYPFTIPRLREGNRPYIEPLAMWNALLGDLILGTPASVIAARFHRGLAKAVIAMAVKLAARESSGGPRFETIALSGGCFQNRILFEGVLRGLEEAGFCVLTQAQVPANDGGLALGQAAVAAARLLADGR